MSGQAWRIWPALVRGFSRSRVRRRFRSRCSLKWLFTASTLYALREKLRDKQFFLNLRNVPQMMVEAVSYGTVLETFSNVPQCCQIMSDVRPMKSVAPRKLLE